MKIIEQELAGDPVPLSQFGQSLQELVITHIKAMTPQAKGRGERLFQTLQDRWVKITHPTIEEANKILPKLVDEHNQQFAVEPGLPKMLLFPFGEVNHWFSSYSIGINVHSVQGKLFLVEAKHTKSKLLNNNKSSPLKTRVDVRQTLDGDLFGTKEQGIPYGKRRGAAARRSLPLMEWTILLKFQQG